MIPGRREAWRVAGMPKVGWWGMTGLGVVAGAVALGLVARSVWYVVQVYRWWTRHE
jgi:hypothetical protein